jgi:Flp pilus assembly protein TadG
MLKRFGSCQKGAAAVEFALLLVPLMLITFGIIEFGLLMYNKQILTNASREGARAGVVATTPAVRFPYSAPVCGTVPPTPTSIECVVAKYCGTNLVTFGGSSSPSTATTGYDANAASGTYLTVTVTFGYYFLVPSLFGITNPKTITAETVMRYE